MHPTHPLEQAVLATLIYADLFDYPLTADEIFRYLICLQTLRPLPTPNSCAVAISDLLSSNQIIYQLPFYALPHRHSLFSLRYRRQIISQTKLKHSQPLIDRLGKLPSIQGIFLTGALAMANSDQNDDLDLLIITRPYSLWTTRFCLNLGLDLLGRRRRPRQITAPDRLCLNLFLDTTSLTIPSPQRNLYTAHEIVQAKPLIAKNHLHSQFLIANAWIKSYLPNFPLPPNQTSFFSPPPAPKPPVLEALMYRFQATLMRPNRTRETISLHSAFFHPRPTGQQILAAFNSAVKSTSPL